MLQFSNADMLTGHWSKVKNMRPRLFSYSESFKDKNSTIAPVWERDYTIDGVTNSKACLIPSKPEFPSFYSNNPGGYECEASRGPRRKWGLAVSFHLSFLESAFYI